MEINLVQNSQGPHFCIVDSSPSWSRVYGASFDTSQDCWLFPAFQPFLQNVLQDLPKVHDNLTFTPELSKWLKEQKSLEEIKEGLSSIYFPVKSYAHQLDGMSETLFNHRWILNWETGTGKSKVIIDTARVLKQKALILCPLIALDNWIMEIEYHTGGELKTSKLGGPGTGQNMAELEKLVSADILVATYDSIRLFGIPKLFDKTTDVFLKAQRYPSPRLKEILRRLNNAKIQIKFAEEWVKGRKPLEIKQEVDSIVRSEPQWIQDFDYSIIAADESHRIKNMKSRRTKAALALTEKASRRYLTTATLNLGDPRELYPQLRFLAPYVLPEDWRRFCDNYLITAPANKHIVVGFRRLDVLNSKVTRLSSAKKLADCIDLPERRFEIISYKLSAQQRKDYNYVVNNWAIERPDADELEIQNGAIRISKLLQLCSGFVYLPPEYEICDTCSKVKECVVDKILPGTVRCIHQAEYNKLKKETLLYHDNPKLDALKDKLTDLVHSSKVIIWATLLEELQIIEDCLKKEGWGYVRVDGSNTSDIKALAERFNNDSKCRVYLAQISTGISITLNAATHTFYFSRSWSLDDRVQSLGRNLRIGQTQKTVVYDLCASGTVEQQQLKALHNKEAISSLLTTRINCSLCNKYENCVKDNVKPWTRNCVLSTSAKKVIAQTRTI